MTVWITRLKNYRRLLVPLLLAAVILAGVVSAFLLLRNRAPEETPARAPVLPPSAPPAPSFQLQREIVRNNDNTAKILERHGFTPSQVDELIKEVKLVYDLKRIDAGQEMRFFTTPKGALFGLDYDIDDVQYLEVRSEEGKYTARKKNIPYVVETAVLFAATGGNIADAFTKLGEREVLGYAFASVFEWDVDFNTDQRPDDTFRLVYEKKFLEGKFVKYGRILAAEFTNQENNQGKPLQAFFFSYSDPEKKDAINTRTGYFDVEGKSLKKEFLKSPFNYQPRITSRYSSRRLHPIHKVVRPHYGVDYGAPAGTAVQATADGSVTFAGSNGGAGRMITLRHRNGYETQYLHLSGLAKGIRKNARVAAGEVIGFVGSSGESTGPHLDYRIKKNGAYLNPLSYKPDPGEPISKEFQADFQKTVDYFRTAFNLPFFFLNRFSPF